MVLSVSHGRPVCISVNPKDSDFSGLRCLYISIRFKLSLIRCAILAVHQILSGPFKSSRHSVESGSLWNILPMVAPSLPHKSYTMAFLGFPHPPPLGSRQSSLLKNNNNPEVSHNDVAWYIIWYDYQIYLGWKPLSGLCQPMVIL